MATQGDKTDSTISAEHSPATAGGFGHTPAAGSRDQNKGEFVGAPYSVSPEAYTAFWNGQAADARNFGAGAALISLGALGVTGLQPELAPLTAPVSAAAGGTVSFAKVIEAYSKNKAEHPPEAKLVLPMLDFRHAHSEIGGNFQRPDQLYVGGDGHSPGHPPQSVLVGPHPGHNVNTHKGGVADQAKDQASHKHPSEAQKHKEAVIPTAHGQVGAVKSPDWATKNGHPSYNAHPQKGGAGALTKDKASHKHPSEAQKQKDAIVPKPASSTNPHGPVGAAKSPDAAAKKGHPGHDVNPQKGGAPTKDQASHKHPNEAQKHKDSVILKPASSTNPHGPVSAAKSPSAATKNGHPPQAVYHPAAVHHAPAIQHAPAPAHYAHVHVEPSHAVHSGAHPAGQGIHH